MAVFFENLKSLKEICRLFASLAFMCRVLYNVRVVHTLEVMAAAILSLRENSKHSEQ